jgi:hypothetical protein
MKTDLYRTATVYSGDLENAINRANADGWAVFNIWKIDDAMSAITFIRKNPDNRDAKYPF